MKNYDPSLDDVIRWIEAYPLMLKACRKLDELDWCAGYELGSQDNQEVLDDALTLARQALNKFKGK